MAARLPSLPSCTDQRGNLCDARQFPGSPFRLIQVCGREGGCLFRDLAAVLRQHDVRRDVFELADVHGRRRGGGEPGRGEDLLLLLQSYRFLLPHAGEPLGCSQR